MSRDVRQTCLVLFAALFLAPCSAPAQTAEAETFPVWEYRVLGNSLLSDADVGRAVYDFLGSDVDFERINQARAALEQIYRDRGYPSVIVNIPEQNVGSDGVVRLQVVEATIDRVRVSGATYHSGRRLRAQFKSVREGEPLNADEFNEDIQYVVAANPGVVVRPLLRPGRAPGTTELELLVDDSFPGRATVEYNNNNSRDTTEPRAGFSIGYDDFFGRGDSLSFQYQTAPEDTDEVKVLAATYVLRPRRGKWIGAAYAVNSDSDVATVGGVTVLGTGNIYGLRAIRPFGATESGSASLTFGLDYKDFDDNVTIDPETGLETEIAYCNASVSFSGNRARGETRFAYGLGANVGLRGLCNSRQEFEDKRFKGQPNYFYLTGNGRIQLPLPMGFGIDLNALGQVTDQPLISNEQFSIGGFGSVRGYYQTELLADMGLTANLDIKLPNFAASPVIETFQPFVFVDWGGGRINEPLPDQLEDFSAWSTGAGLTISGFGGFVGTLFYARAGRDGLGTLKGDSRVYFDFGYQF